VAGQPAGMHTWIRHIVSARLGGGHLLVHRCSTLCQMIY